MSVYKIPKHIRLMKEAKQQVEVEHLWKSLKKVIDRNIFKQLYSFETPEEKRGYLKDLETIFIQYACGFKVPKYKIYKSKAFRCMKCISRKRDLTPSKFRRTLTQIEQCSRRKNKNPRFIDMD